MRQTGAVIDTRTMYGQEWDGWPTNYFVFAFDSSPLDALTAKLEEKHAQEVLPPWKRIDCICVLNQGVILNQFPGGTFDALPDPGSQLRYYETQRALLLFYTLVSKYVFQAEIPHFRFTDYLGQLRF